MRAAIFALIWISHAYLMFFHREKMGAEESDNAADPIYSKLRANLAFTAVSVAMAFGFLLSLVQHEGHLAILIIGCCIYLGGMLLRIWAIKVLGRFFTFEIGIRGGHEVIQNGPYRILRHPSYTGYLLMLIGSGIAMENPLIAGAVLIGAFSFLVLRISQEEKMLAQHFGEKYVAYQKRTYRLIPFLY